MFERSLSWKRHNFQCGCIVEVTKFTFTVSYHYLMSKSTSIYIFAKEEEIDIIDEVFNSEQFWAIVAEMQGDKISDENK